MSALHRIRTAAGRLARRLVGSSSEIILTYDLSRPLPPFRARAAVTVVRVAMPTRTEPADALTLPAEVIARRLRRGDVGYAAWMDGKMVSHCWLGFGDWILPDLGITLPLGGDAFAYDSYTRPSLRGLGIMPQLMDGLAAACLERGATLCYARVAQGNRAIRKTLARAGVTPRAELTAVLLLGRLALCRVRVLEDGDPFLGVLRSPAARFRPGLLVWSTPRRRGVRVITPTSPWRR